MTVFTWLWIAWGAAFLVIEGVALVNKQPGDTLSEHVWRWFRIKGKSPSWTAARFGLLAFLVWLTGHLAFGLWAG